MTWSLKRQISYIVLLSAFVFLFGFLVVYPQFKGVPNCMDGKQNGNETGVDCGGSCLRACFAEVNLISIIWSRSFRVVPGRYNAVAYLENPNRGSAVNKINYRFRFADANNVYIGKRDGSIFVPPSGKFAVFEPAVDVGNSIPVYTTFEFTEKPDWLQVPMEKMAQLRLLISDIRLEDTDTTPRLSATIENKSLFTIPEVQVVTVLHDAFGNALSASSTYIDVLGPEEVVEVNFTWPEPIFGQIVEKEIIPMFNIFSAKLK